MNNPMKILVVANEIVPFYKRGGLGDVIGALPNALRKIDVDVRVVVPYYNDIKNKYHLKENGAFEMNFDSKKERIGVYSTVLPESQAPVYFLENKQHLCFYNVRGRNKKIEQFVFFDLAVAHFVKWVSEHHKWSPSIVHCNDWHTGLIPLILKRKMQLSTPTLLTIHNLLYQGIGPSKILGLLGMKNEETKELKSGQSTAEINLLGEGIVSATRVSTVSPSYAKEIDQAKHDRNRISSFLIKRGQEGLERDGNIVGILNGIDCSIWNPAKDDIIFHKYDVNSWEVGKKDNKQDLLRSLGLEDRPTFCFVGRMATQKGLDIFIKVINRISHLNINVIILGSGSPQIQKSVVEITKKYPWVKGEIVYSEDLAHKIFAGSDFIVVPSRYEPCGLIQMIAMRYGTIPIASDTGGLKDSILSGRNGFLFKKGKSRRLKRAIGHALNRMKDRDGFRRIVDCAMKTDFSWDKSAVLYKKLYKEMLRDALKAKSQDTSSQLKS
jgi:starch synthase